TALGDRLGTLAAADRRVAAFTAETRIVPLGLDDADAAFASECVERLHAELSGRAAGRLLLLEPLMTAALVALVRAGSASVPVDGLADRDRRRIETLTTLLAAHFREHRPVSFYAEAIGVSPAHLNRLARSATGFSVQGLATLQ